MNSNRLNRIEKTGVKKITIKDVKKIEKREKEIEKLYQELKKAGIDIPHNINAKIKRANYYYYLKKYSIAIKKYNEILKINPKQVDALINKGITLERQKKYKEAVKCYDKALKNEPKNKDALIYKNASLSLLGLDTVKLRDDPILRKFKVVSKKIEKELEHEQFAQRTFKTLHKKIKGPKNNELRRLLVYLGALRFTMSDGNEYWGYAERSMNFLDYYDEKVAKAILKKMKKNSKTITRYLVKILLGHPKWRQRSFNTILQKFGSDSELKKDRAFTKDEIRDILISSGAVAFRDRSGKEYWGLKNRNRDLL